MFAPKLVIGLKEKTTEAGRTGHNAFCFVSLPMWFIPTLHEHTWNFKKKKQRQTDRVKSRLVRWNVENIQERWWFCFNLFCFFVVLLHDWKRIFNMRSKLIRRTDYSSCFGLKFRFELKHKVWTLNHGNIFELPINRWKLLKFKITLSLLFINKEAVCNFFSKLKYLKKSKGQKLFRQT